MNVILASASPRRKWLLEKIVPAFEIIPSSYDEPALDLPFDELAKTYALEKAKDVAKDHPDAIVIGGDSFVVFKNEFLGKPKDETDARRMLQLISGKMFDAYSGVAVVRGNKEVADCVHAKQGMKDMSDDEISAYIASGLPLDKAGGVGEEGLGAALMNRVEGDYFAVVGLPLCRLAELLREVGLDVFKLPSQ